MEIHNSAIVDKKAKIHKGCKIGPYCVIGPHVELMPNVKLHSHVCIEGYTTIGENTEIFPFAALGFRPQDLKYDNESSRITIGKNNVIREYVTIHPGTKDGGMVTKIGDGCLLMINVHIAHDCQIGNNVIMANNATLGGHVSVGDNAILGGLSAYHQFVRIGNNAIIGGGSIVVTDVIPYGNVMGERAWLVGLNIVGMKRNNIPRDEIKSLQEAFDKIFLKSNVSIEENAESLKQVTSNTKLLEIIDFILSSGKRPLCVPKGEKYG